jgi:IS30 family transposase
LVYFADPYAAWQRGTNENTNGILRFYFPMGTDFRKISDKKLESVVRKINNRPRKCLNYRSPHEIMQAAQRGALVT